VTDVSVPPTVIIATMTPSLHSSTSTAVLGLDPLDWSTQVREIVSSVVAGMVSPATGSGGTTYTAISSHGERSEGELTVHSELV